MGYEFDVVTIGAGPGGYVAAIRASQLGLKTAVVERDKPGGVCLNIGCIPSKTLIHQAGIVLSIPELKSLGATVDSSTLDYRRAFARSRQAADTLSKGVAFLLKKNNVTLVQGTGTIAGPHEVTVDNKTRLSSRAIVVATGSRPRSIPGFELDGRTVLSSDNALMLESLPKSLLILGGGAIGVEFAHIMNAFGVNVHIVELLQHLLPMEDAEIARVLERSFAKRGITSSVSSKAVSLTKGSGGVEVMIENGDGERETHRADAVLAVVGRAPNTEGIGLESVGITTENGFIPAGDWCRTSAESVYAIGDVIATPQLAHVASKEGEIAAEHIAGKTPRPRVDTMAVPTAVYCDPQVASFGLTEEKARTQGVPYAKATFPYRGCGKAVAVGRTEGMVKVLTHAQTGEILGAHAVGADATELIHEMLLARSAELLPADIAGMVHAHPTLSEVVMEAMRASEGWAIHA